MAFVLCTGNLQFLQDFEKLLCIARIEIGPVQTSRIAGCWHERGRSAGSQLLLWISDTRRVVAALAS
jgi:hypothetical protein